MTALDPEKMAALAVYEDATSLFFYRLEWKHALKGISHRGMTIKRLFLLLNDEVKELQEAIEKEDELSIIEEAADVMVCGLLFLDFLSFWRKDKEARS